MEDYIMTIIKRASIFMILAQAVIHFRPNPSYEKYFKFLAGIMTAVILIIPVMDLIHSGISEQYETCVDGYMERLQKLSEQSDGNVISPSQSYLYTMGEEIKTKLNKSEKLDGYYVKTVEIKEIQEDKTEDGEIGYRIKILTVHEDKGISTIKVDKIKLQRENVDIENDGEESREKEALRKKIADVLEIEPDWVEVMIDE